MSGTWSEVIGGPLAAPGEDTVRAALLGAASMAGELARQTWAAMALEVGAYDTGGYQQGIKTGEVKITAPPDDGAATFEVVVEVVNRAPHASIVEEGHGAFALPERIDWTSGGGSIKINKDGRPYIHVPFRHTTGDGAGGPSDGETRSAAKARMPSEVYEAARGLAWRVPNRAGPLRRQGPDLLPPRPGLFMQRDSYRWDTFGRPVTGHALSRGTPSTAFTADPRSGQLYQERRPARLVGVGTDDAGRPMRNPEWKSSRYEGLFRTGGPGHSSYMTVRTLTPDSEGWRIPAQAGYYVAAKTATALGSGPELGDLFASALTGALAGATGSST